MSDLEDLQPRQKSNRITRNQRVTEEDSDDEDFYKQEFWNDAETEDAFVYEAQQEDVFDSDFWDTEESSDEEEIKVVDEKVKQQGVYKDPVLQSRKERQGITLKVEKKKPKRKRVKKEVGAVQRRSQRGSVKARTEKVDTRTKREQARKEIRKQIRPTRKRKPKRKLTQEQLLKEAATTEIINRQSLRDLLAREQAIKRRATIKKKKYEGPVTRYYSSRREKMITFTQTKEFPEYLKHKFAPMYPKRNYCNVTGERARYLDPDTKEPYSNLEAFKKIRLRTTAMENAAVNGTIAPSLGPPQLVPLPPLSSSNINSKFQASSSRLPVPALHATTTNILSRFTTANTSNAITATSTATTTTANTTPVIRSNITTNTRANNPTNITANTRANTRANTMANTMTNRANTTVNTTARTTANTRATTATATITPLPTSTTSLTSHTATPPLVGVPPMLQPPMPPNVATHTQPSLQQRHMPYTSGLGDLASLPSIPGLPDISGLPSANLPTNLSYGLTNLLPPLSLGGNVPLTPGSMGLTQALPMSSMASLGPLNPSMSFGSLDNLPPFGSIGTPGTGPNVMSSVHMGMNFGNTPGGGTGTLTPVGAGTMMGNTPMTDVNNFGVGQVSAGGMHLTNSQFDSQFVPNGNTSQLQNGFLS